MKILRFLLVIHSCFPFLFSMSVSTASESASPAFMRDGPRLVVLGTCTMAPFDSYFPGGDPQRLQTGLKLIREMVAKAEEKGESLDLVLLPELFASNTGNPQEMDGEILTEMGKYCRRFNTYIAVPVLLGEGGDKFNAVVILDRQGKPAGSYRKVHVVTHPDGSLEGGTAPGKDFPVFDLDFGRVGVQICWDGSYEDGWMELGRKGAELVLYPSASSAVANLKSYAFRNSYYILASTFRPPTVVVDPLGKEVARTSDNNEVQVVKIDLDYRIIPWNSLTDFGVALGEKYGDRINQDWHYEEDVCLLTSTDPDLPIEEVMEKEGLFTRDTFVAKNWVAQNRERGRPPATLPGDDPRGILSGWFGIYNSDRWPWVYHMNHGWMYCQAAPEKAVYLFHESMGWLWTTPDDYPWLYQYARSRWIAYSSGMLKKQRFYYRNEAGEPVFFLPYAE